MTKTHLLAKMQELESAFEALLLRAKRFPPAQLRFQPAPASWSIMQVLEHLYLAEMNTVNYLESKGIALAKSKRSKPTGVIRTALLVTVLRSPLKFKIPSERVRPTAKLALDELETQWRETRHRLKDFVEGFPAENYHSPVLPHPRAGLLTLSQTLTFLNEHFRHHLRQVERIRNAKGFPSDMQDHNVNAP